VLRGVFTHLVSVKFRFHAADIARSGQGRIARAIVIFIGNKSKKYKATWFARIAAGKFDPREDGMSRLLFHQRLLPLSNSLASQMLVGRKLRVVIADRNLFYEESHRWRRRICTDGSKGAKHIERLVAVSSEVSIFRCFSAAFIRRVSSSTFAALYWISKKI